MYVDGYMLLVIYLLSVFAAAVSVYALWTLEEIRRHYERKSNSNSPNAYEQFKNRPPVKPTRGKGHWDK
jgi:flagellar basal body-associated protein FliL